jgi:flagellar hook protein FlgE
MSGNLLGTLYKAMSGLNAFTRSLDNISNNVANLNTAGFKANDVFYRELAGNSEAGFSGADNGQMGIGQGVAFGGTTIRFTDGELSESGSEYHLAIDGNGLFILRNSEQEFYSRAGVFALDADGYLVNPANGYRVAKLDEQGRLQDINLREVLTSEALATTEVFLRGTLNQAAVEGTRFPPVTATQTDRVSFTVYDGNGDDSEVFAAFTKLADNQWRVDFTNEDGAPLADAIELSFGDTGAPSKDTISQTIDLNLYDQVGVDDVAGLFTAVDEISIVGFPGELDRLGEITLQLSDGEFVKRPVTGAGNQTFASAVIIKVDASGNLVDADSGDVVLARNAESPDSLLNASIAVSSPAQATASLVISGALALFEDESGSVPTSDIFPPVTDQDTGSGIQDNPIRAVLYDQSGAQYDVAISLVRVDSQAERVEYQVVFNRGQPDEFSADRNLVYVLDTATGVDAWVLQAGNPRATYVVSNDQASTVIRFEIKAGESDELSGLKVLQSGASELAAEQLGGRAEGSVTGLAVDGSGKVLVRYDNGAQLDGPTLAVVQRTVTGLRADFSAVSAASFVSSSIEIEKVDGRATGQLAGFTIETDGTIVLNYSNEDEVEDGRIALALFGNTAVLKRAGDALFTADDVSQRVLGSGQDGAFGGVIQRSVERSNVELSREFAEIIIVQRGFQASSQVLNVTNEMIQELYDSTRGGR